MGRLVEEYSALIISVLCALIVLGAVLTCVGSVKAASDRQITEINRNLDEWEVVDAIGD